MIYFHRCAQGGEGKYVKYPPLENFKTFVNINAIKPKQGYPTGNFFLKALTLIKDFGKNFKYPLPWIFSPCVSMLFPQHRKKYVKQFEKLDCRVNFVSGLKNLKEYQMAIHSR